MPLSLVHCDAPRVLRKPKVCSCGMVHAIARGSVCESGHFWYTFISCGSTLIERNERWEAVRRINEKADELSDGDPLGAEIRAAMQALGYDWEGDYDLFEEALNFRTKREDAR